MLLSRFCLKAEGRARIQILKSVRGKLIALKKLVEVTFSRKKTTAICSLAFSNRKRKYEHKVMLTLVGVQFGQFVHREMTFNLMFINNTSGQGLFCHLTIVDFFFHGAFSHKSVDVDWFFLSKPIDSEYGLNIMSRIP